MKPRFEDVLDEAIVVSEKSVNLMLVSLVTCTVLSYVFSDARLLIFPPLLTSSYFLLELSRRVYSLYARDLRTKAGLVVVAPFYLATLTVSLSLLGVLTVASYILAFIGSLMILIFRVVAAKREVDVVM
ncbi:hypothetical protein IG193_07060 [Infirmifilum lucidum]|uniref:Uncharacterized protein n=1 Tax=Infirmifilum lucidum TaxID=2776706 RepID=A0A7L9FFC8_9CREN|nr:hypothetical protein [Infirmifilum lucidum]QOJ78508.1 hypothetical protein IG193_07060 [Infirmifilum lucidum]